MLDQESPEEQQKAEFVALKSIYPDELIDLRKKLVWKHWSPLHLSLTLQSQGDDVTEASAKVDLHISCSSRYPNEPPEIELKQSQGLTKSELVSLRREIEELAASKIGEVMIFNLADYVMEFLHSHRKPKRKSFYDEMVTRQKRKEEEEREALQREEDREREVLQREIQQREEMSKSTIKNFNEMSSEDNTFCAFNSKRESNASVVENCNCDKDASKLIRFLNNSRIIQKGKCLSHKHNSLVTFNSMDNQSGELLVMYEWNIEKDNSEDTVALSKLISAIEQEFTFLVKLKHPNLIHYLNLKCDYVSDKHVNIYLLREFAYGVNCEELYLSNNISVDVDMLRYIAGDILNALDYLHQNNVVHKEIGPSSVYLTKTNIKLANFSLYRRFNDITISTSSSNYNKRTDIYRFGLLLLSLLKGSVVDEITNLPESISNDLYNFLTKCLGENDKDKRYTTQQLLEHPFIKLPIVKCSLSSDPNLSPERYVTLEQQLADLQQMYKYNAAGPSRVYTEFEVLHTIGKGAFGEVLKVRNKLDQRFYAIKRMVLNPKRKQGNKKIIQEVKTLSRLNHEHVVRYFNSWIESTVIDYDESGTVTTDTSAVTPLVGVIKKQELTINDSYIEKMAPPIVDEHTKEWSISFRPKSNNRASESSDDTSDISDSDSIEFERDDDDVVEEPSPESESRDTTDSSRKRTREIQYMYIQMEFCEKSTLRNAIDADLYTDKDRVWRLFREVVDGLIYIHKQGMIHRDLKPVNIFLNKNDHVKIGDFGLATPSLLPKTSEIQSAYASQNESGLDRVDKSLTGHVGTALYVAPEIDTEKPTYNQRVDTYSLGIIFFEMCYKPMKTGMERIVTLTKLRTKEIEFPNDFLKCSTIAAQNIIKLLLTHTGNERPSSLELKEKYLPYPVERDNVIVEHIKNALRTPHLKIYKDFISLCMQQDMTCAQDILFDRDPAIWNAYKYRKVYDFIRKSVIKVFKLHGGQNIPTPLLMPKSKYYKHLCNCVKLMMNAGSVVSLPHDLRVPFARYLAWNEITMLRRFSIERVFRESKESSRIPRELYECAFDIVTPNRGHYIADAELFYIFKEIVDCLPGVSNKKFIIRLNHPLLVRSILLHCTIKDKHDDIFTILSVSDLKDNQIKGRVQIHLISLGFSESVVALFFKLLESEVPSDKIDSHFHVLTRKKSTEIGDFAKKALHELKDIIQIIESFGIEYSIIIAPSLVYKIEQYSGVMFQICCSLRKKHNKAMDILAAGGRYDDMIIQYRSILEKANLHNKDIQQTAVGISISLDKMVSAFVKHQIEGDDDEQMLVKATVDATVFCVGMKPNIKEKTKLMTDLWAAGIKSSVIEIGNEDMINEELKAHFDVILTDSEQGVVRVRYWERERIQSKRVKRTELVDFIQNIKSNFYQRSDSKTINEKSEPQNDASVNIIFVTADKTSSGMRKKYENQIWTQLEKLIDRFNGEVVVLVLSLDLNIIRTLSSYLDFENEFQFKGSVKIIIDKHQQNRKYLSEVCDEIRKIKSKKTQPIVILYSLPDSVYKVIL